MTKAEKIFKKEVSGWFDEAKEEFRSTFENFTNIEKINALIKKNNGYITSREITLNGISRQYLKKMIDDDLIEKVNRGVYIDNKIMEDEFYTFQLRYPNTIFSHFTALAFHDMTESIPYNYDITCVNNVFANEFKNQNVFYIKKEWKQIGLCEIIDKYGFKIKVYDLERSICDIIRSKKRLDMEQVKKSVRRYVTSSRKNILKLQKYAKAMGIYNEVMDFVGMYYE